MTKLLWVAMPLILAACIVGVLALRRRTPTRHALNVWFSLLLMAYVLTTAGLGIFWVANQQLPVFDWHYLFGYGTVLLVVLHLAFNFRVVWRHLTGHRLASTAPTPSGPARRGWLAALGVLAVAGVSFALGLRHGRSEVKLASAGPPGAAPAPGPTPATSMDFVERFHAFSSHSRAGVMLRAPGVDWGDPPPPFKPYAGAERLVLPRPQGVASTGLDLAALGAMLWHTSAVTLERGGLMLRASPSSGALFSTELYVSAHRVSGIAPGLWHYDPRSHALERVAATPLEPWVDGDPAALVVATAIFRRTGHKYRDRTYRYVLADLGHALENLRVSAEVFGARPQSVSAFDESQVARDLGLDEAEEGGLAMMVLPGTGRLVEPIAADWRAPDLQGIGAAKLGVTAAIHRASSLRRRERPAGQGSASELAPPRSGATINPPLRFDGAASAPTPLEESAVLRVIARRRSVRRFSSTPLPRDALTAVLARMSAPPTLSSAVRINLVANAVAGLAPGAYRFDPTTASLLPRRAPADLRSAAHAAALDQDVIGDAAVVFVLSIDRGILAADPFGPARAYRHAFLEAGMVGERIYLEGVARGLGVCAVGAFYDDEATRLVSLDPAREWPVHFAALGVPAG